VKIQEIRKLLKESQYSVSTHAFIESFADGFSIKDILRALNTGDIIEEYKDRNRLLIYAKLGTNSIHVVVDYSSVNYLWIVTVYKPDPKEWVDGKIRRQ